MDRQEKVQLSKDDVVSFVKGLLPRLDPNKKLRDYARKGTCVDWLTSVADVTPWGDEMEAVSKEVLDTATHENQRDFFLNN